MEPETITNGRFALNALARMLVPIGLGEWLLLAVCIGVCVLVFHRIPGDHGDRWRPLSTSAAMGVWSFYCVKDTSCGIYDLILAVCGRYSYQQWGLLEFHEWTGDAAMGGTGVNRLLVLLLATLRLGLGIFAGCMVRTLHTPAPGTLALRQDLAPETGLADEAELWLAQREEIPDWQSADAIGQAIRAIADACEVGKAVDGQPNYYGYRLVDDDLGGMPDPLWRTVATADLEQARRQYRLYGAPGGGLSGSGFAKGEVISGRKGERALARIIVANCPNVVSFWSLYGLNDRRHRTEADIDCVIAGQDRQGRTRLWFVDAKNYKGGADTAYRNVTPTRLLRVSIGHHAFENGPDGRPDIELSGNMDWQRRNWAPLFEGRPVIAEWLVCMVPVTDKGVPDVNGVYWPGDIPCVTPEELVERVNAADLDSAQNIPLDLLDLLKRQLKGNRRNPS